MTAARTLGAGPALAEQLRLFVIDALASVPGLPGDEAALTGERVAACIEGGPAPLRVRVSVRHDEIVIAARSVGDRTSTAKQALAFGLDAGWLVWFEQTLGGA